MVTTITTDRSLVERLRDRLQGRKVEGERGLALLDVLLGMAIFGFIISIAMQTFGQYRERAFESTSLSDVNSVAIEMEAVFNDTQSYPAYLGVDTTNKTYVQGASSTVNKAMAAKESRGMSVGAYTPDTTNNTWKVCLEHTSGSKKDAYATFNSATGQTTSGRGTGCPAVTTY